MELDMAPLVGRREHSHPNAELLPVADLDRLTVVELEDDLAHGEEFELLPVDHRPFLRPELERNRVSLGHHDMPL